MPLIWSLMFLSSAFSAWLASWNLVSISGGKLLRQFASGMESCRSLRICRKKRRERERERGKKKERKKPATALIQFPEQLDGCHGRLQKKTQPGANWVTLQAQKNSDLASRMEKGQKLAAVRRRHNACLVGSAQKNGKRLAKISNVELFSQWWFLKRKNSETPLFSKQFHVLLNALQISCVCRIKK